MSEAREEDFFEDAVPTVPLIACWRCELDIPADRVTCPHCEAALDSLAPEDSRKPRATKPRDPLKVLMWSYVLLLATTIIHAVVMNETVGEDREFDDQVRTQVLIEMLAIEVVDTVIIGVAMFMCYGAVRLSPDPLGQQLRTWLIFVPLLGVLLLVNFQYHWLLRNFLQVPLIQDQLTTKYDWLLFLTYCVQPAIVEEVYCRGFVLNILRSVLGRHWSVWISAIMFGLLHVGSPLGIPYLMVLGAYLGYARLASGSLVLPVFLHFVHNLLVLLWD